MHRGLQLTANTQWNTVLQLVAERSFRVLEERQQEFEESQPERLAWSDVEQILATRRVQCKDLKQILQKRIELCVRQWRMLGSKLKMRSDAQAQAVLERPTTTSSGGREGCHHLRLKPTRGAEKPTTVLNAAWLVNPTRAGWQQLPPERKVHAVAEP